MRANPAAHVGALEVGKAEVEDDEIRRVFGGFPQRVGAGAGDLHLESTRAQERRHGALDGDLVVHEQDACGARHVSDDPAGSGSFDSEGTAIVNSAPPPGRFSAQTRPWSAANNPRAIDSPMPVPEARCVASLPR